MDGKNAKTLEESIMERMDQMDRLISLSEDNKVKIEEINKKRYNSQLEVSNYIDKLRCDIESLDQIINND